MRCQPPSAILVEDTQEKDIIMTTTKTLKHYRPQYTEKITHNGVSYMLLSANGCFYDILDLKSAHLKENYTKRQHAIDAIMNGEFS